MEILCLVQVGVVEILRVTQEEEILGVAWIEELGPRMQSGGSR